LPSHRSQTQGKEHMSIEVMKQALEALRQALSEAQLSVNENSRAIEQAEKQEPVAWYFKGLTNRGVSLIKENDGWIPLYTTPQPQRTWVGLTDDEVFDLADENLYNGGKNYGILSFYKAIEAKLWEKNT
jgi:hypothetical protein